MRHGSSRRPSSAGSNLIGRIAALATGRPRLVIGIWIVLVLALAQQGKDLDQKLSFEPPFIAGTESRRAHEISEQEFGNDSSLVVMLRGPRRQVELQGTTLARRVGALPQVLVVSPWTRGGAVEGLNPRPGVATLIVRFEDDSRDEIADFLGPVRAQIDRTVKSPVTASVAGFPVVVDSIRSAGERATALGEMIAVPVLFLVLLLVFRSVFAALLPLIVGGAVVAATRGALSLLTGLVHIDLFSVGVVGMMGLALGVDYSLLVVSRFREEQGDRDIASVVHSTVTATARAVIPAGSGLVLAMLAAALVLPGAVLHSVAIAIIAATVLSVLSAIVVVPALLMVFGAKLDRWALPRRNDSQVAPLRLARQIGRHPRLVISVFIFLLFFSGVAFTLKSSPASVALLPSADEGRRQAEEIKQTLGPGWITPMEVIMNGQGKPITTPRRLRALAAFQRRVEADPGVASVAGLARIERGARQLSAAGDELAASERGLERLGVGISRVREGTALTSRGLFKAAAGAQALEAGVGATRKGAGLLADSVQMVGSGSSRLSDGLTRADEGSGKLATGTTKASTGAGKLAEGLEKAQEGTGEVLGTARLFKGAMRTGEDRLDELHAPLRESEAQLAAAWQALQRMTTGKTDPEYAAALRAVEEASLRLTGSDIQSGEPPNPSYEGVEAGIEGAGGQFEVGTYLATKLEDSGRRAKKGIGKLADASERLDRGLRRLATGSRQVSGGIEELAEGGQKLPPALTALGEGAQRLTGALGQLEMGAGQLAGGLGTGARKSRLLTGALTRIDNGLERQGGPQGSQTDDLQKDSPGLFRSAYFVLAALDGSRPERRRQLGFLINLDRGGLNARMLVIPRDEETSPETRQTRDRLQDDADVLAEETGAEVVVGGLAAAEMDVNDAYREQSLLLRFALSLISMLILIPVMRSVTIPFLAALMNLITVSAALGLLAVLFNGSLLGGPGYVEAAVIPATMMVMFGLAIDYEVFVFARMREEYVRTGSPRAAIENGLDRTAHVVTGAAIIMISVFLAFSVSDLMSIRNFGVAQAIAVFIDAFIVRLILVPAIMIRLGEWSWWMPRWLDRILPGGR